MNTSLVIPAAGNGTRLGQGTTPKALVSFGEGTLIGSILNSLSGIFTEIVLVIKPGVKELFQNELRKELQASEFAKLRYVFQEKPVGSLDAVCTGVNSCSKHNKVIITWCDQVGISRDTVLHLLGALDSFDFGMPYLPMNNPYVWIERANESISHVYRSRDGDAQPKSGDADLGVFGFSAHGANYLLSQQSSIENAIENRELDFTYALVPLTATLKSALIKTTDANQALAVNSMDELRNAERRINNERN